MKKILCLTFSLFGFAAVASSATAAADTYAGSECRKICVNSDMLGSENCYTVCNVMYTQIVRDAQNKQ